MMERRKNLNDKFGFTELMRIKLIDICSPKQWKTIPTDELLDVGYPVYGANGLIGYSNIYNHKDSVIAITCRGASCGSVNITPPFSYITGNAMCLDEVKHNIDIEYLYYYLKSYNFKNIISGSAQPQITRQGLTKVYVRYYSITKQKQIVTRLKSINTIIELRKIELNKLDDLIKARFIEMFGDLKSNEKDWDLKTFEEMSVLITDGEHSTPKRTKEGIYLLSARNVLNHSLQLKDVDYINRDEYLRIAKRVVPKKGDILISCSGTIGRCCSVPDSVQLQMVRSVALIRFKEVINPIFAEYMITSDYLQEQINSSKTMSSQANLFQGKIRKLKGFLPPTELQQQFADFVQQVDKSREEVKKSLEKTQQLYDSLMQEYFG